MQPAYSWCGVCVQALPWLGNQPAAELLAEMLTLPLGGLDEWLGAMLANLNHINHSKKAYFALICNSTNSLTCRNAFGRVGKAVIIFMVLPCSSVTLFFATL